MHRAPPTRKHRTAHRPAARTHFVTRHVHTNAKPDHGIRSTIGEHSWLIVIVCGYIVGLYLTAWLTGVTRMLDVKLYLPIVTITAICFSIAFLGVHVVMRIRTMQPKQCLCELRDEYLTRHRVVCFLVVAACLSPFMSAFGSFKQAIPIIVPFSIDSVLVDIDRALHVGRHPWELMQPIVGSPFVTFVIQCCYNAWIFVMFGILMWQAWSRNQKLRMQFFLSFVLSWIVIGTVLATLLSSAGPCYYERLTGVKGPFGPLMEYLSNVNSHWPLPSLAVQERLWHAYQSGQPSVIAGISAMPSMHVATAVLFALLGWQVNRRLGWALTAFAVVIQIGSVHLAWHYAIDGYVGAILAVMIWHGVGKTMAKWGQS